MQMNMKPGINWILRLLVSLFLLSPAAFSPAMADMTVDLENYERSAWNIGKMENIAVVDVSGNNQGLGEEISNRIADKIADQKFFRVKNRHTTNETLENAGVHLHGIPDTARAKDICRTLQVDGVIYGKVDAAFSTVTRYRYNYDDYDYRGRRRYPRRYEEPYLERSGYVKMELYFYSLESDKVIGQVKDRVSFFRNYSYYGNYDSPSDHDMIFKLLDELLSRYIYKFTPHFTVRKRKLTGSEGQAFKSIRDNKWDEAAAFWQADLQDDPLNYNALRNLGIYYEHKGEYKKAVDFYGKALKIRPGDEDLELYTAQAKNADLLGDNSRPLPIPQGGPKFKIAKIESMDRVLVTIGDEKGIKPGDTLLVGRKIPLFDEKITKIQGEGYFAIAKYQVDKVLEGVCFGKITNLAPKYQVEVNDPVFLAPEQSSPGEKTPDSEGEWEDENKKDVTDKPGEEEVKENKDAETDNYEVSPVD